MFTLITREHDVTRRHPLPEGTSLIGRSLDCSIVINDESISRQHARIVIRHERIRLIDLGSSNGTCRNGIRISETEVSPGDTLTFGGVEATITSGMAPVTDPHPSDAPPDPAHTMMRRIDSQPGTVGDPPPVDAGRVIRLLGEIARTLLATLPLSDMLERVVDLLVAHIPAERAYLWLRDPITGEFAPHIARPAHALDTASISRTVLDLAVRERVAVLTLDAKVDPRFEHAESIHRSDIRSLICGPLSAGEDVIGVLYIDNPLSRQFQPADLEVFTALANYAAVAIAQAKLAARVVDESRRRERLERYHSPAIVEQVMRASALGEESVAEERDVSVLFADLVGFTPLAEHATPREVTGILNLFLSIMTDVIFAHEGTVDKFIGDAVLAVFGAPVPQPDHAARAVRTAQAMMRALGELNKDRPGATPWRMRIAINSGIAIVGDIGSPKRREYTVLGDVVNTASRLESTIAEPDQIVISDATYQRIQPGIPATFLGSFTLRGKDTPIGTYSCTW